MPIHFVPVVDLGDLAILFTLIVIYMRMKS